MMILATAKEKDKEMRIGSIYIPSIGGFCVFKKSYVNPMQILHVGVVPVAHSIYRNFELVGHENAIYISAFFSYLFQFVVVLFCNNFHIVFCGIM